jgi:hypothetical protein
VAASRSTSRGPRFRAALVVGEELALPRGVDKLAPILPWGAEGSPKLSPVDAATRTCSRRVRGAWDRRATRKRPWPSQEVVLVTVPASFDEVARELTLESARAAGLAVRLLEEPQAAFYDV